MESSFVGSSPSSKKKSKSVVQEDPESVRLFNEMTELPRRKESVRVLNKIHSPFASVRSNEDCTLPDYLTSLNYSLSSSSDFINSCIERLEKGIPLREIEIKQLCTKAQEVLMNESNIVKVSSPVTVVGDIHGQFWDVIEMFRIGGPLPSTNYLFLGDYVDRGKHSVLTMSLLLCYKLKWPQRITLLRGKN